MDYDSSTKFISSLAKFLQSLCNGYVEFDNGVQVIGHLYLSVDTGKTIDYVLNEKVCKTDENSVTFISNSFHAQPAERPKPQGKRTARDRQDVKSEDKDNNSVEQIEPRSTNHGTVQTARGSGENSPLGNNGKRPLSPSQRQFKDDASLSGRVSPRSKKSRTDSFDQNTSHPSNLNNENSISSAPSPAGDSGPASMSAQNSDAPQDSSYSESYQQQTFFPPSEEEHSVGGSERDIKPSLDTDVTFIKEEYAPSSCSQSDTQGRDRNQVEDSSMYPTMFPSSHSYPSGAYAGHGNYGASTPGSQRSNFSSSSDRHSGMYASGQSSTQLEPGENTSDPSVRQMVQLEEINPLDTHDDSLVSSLCGMSDQKQVKAEPDLKKTPPKWAERARKYSCHFCWKSFVVKRDWEGHINSVHLKAKPFRCHICSWSSAHRGELQKHVKKCARLYGHLVKPASTTGT